MSTFNKDLKEAQEVENEFGNKLAKLGYTVTSTANLGAFSGYDLIAVKNNITYTFELKYDKMSEVTGNVAIELYKTIGGVNLASGLSISKAEYTVYKLKDKFFSIATAKLKDLIGLMMKNKTISICQGGDNRSVTMALLSKYLFKSSSKEVK